MKWSDARAKKHAFMQSVNKVSVRPGVIEADAHS